jgi:coenzyme F420-0:L-glutamate ligase/coenzyme F420-1:gamma-L-glutamate ligase
LAAAASLVMGQAAQACPVVIARGVKLKSAEVGSSSLLREKSRDMFR